MADDWRGYDFKSSEGRNNFMRSLGSISGWHLRDYHDLGSRQDGKLRVERDGAEVLIDWKSDGNHVEMKSHPANAHHMAKIWAILDEQHGKFS